MVYSPYIFALPAKHPLDDVDYPISLTDWLESGETMTITSCVFDTGITLGTSTKAPSIDANLFIFWLSGGTSGATYFGQAVIETSGNRMFILDFSISVIDPTS